MKKHLQIKNKETPMKNRITKNTMNQEYKSSETRSRKRSRQMDPKNKPSEGCNKGVLMKNENCNQEMEGYTLMKANYPENEKYEKVAFPEKLYRIPSQKPTRIYCDGIFDLFHYGHTRLFSQVKSMFPNVFLIVGVCNDELTLKYKGNTVMNEKERYESIRQCKYVDEVIENAPWEVSLEFLEEHQIDYVAHDDAPYVCEGCEDVYGFLKKIGRFIPTKRAAKISTTLLITRILKNYPTYVRRQFLRGISLKEMNIPFLMRNQIKIKNSLDEDMKYMKQEFQVALKYWEGLSERVIEKIKSNLSDDTSFVARLYNMIANKSKKEEIAA